LKDAFATATCSEVGDALQQEWDDDILPWPHCDAMCRQQADSSAVATAPGNIHASTGLVASNAVSRKTPILATYFTE